MVKKKRKADLEALENYEEKRVEEFFADTLTLWREMRRVAETSEGQLIVKSANRKFTARVRLSVHKGDEKC